MSYVHYVIKIDQSPMYDSKITSKGNKLLMAKWPLPIQRSVKTDSYLNGFLEESVRGK